MRQMAIFGDLSCVTFCPVLSGFPFGHAPQNAYLLVHSWFRWSLMNFLRLRCFYFENSELWWTERLLGTVSPILADTLVWRHSWSVLLIVNFFTLLKSFPLIQETQVAYLDSGMEIKRKNSCFPTEPSWKLIQAKQEFTTNLVNFVS